MDKIIKCDSCGENFTFTEGEQKFYEEHNFEEPKRCKACRNARKNYKRGGYNNG